MLFIRTRTSTQGSFTQELQLLGHPAFENYCVQRLDGIYVDQLADGFRVYRRKRGQNYTLAVYVSEAEAERAAKQLLAGA
jgi:hypothetical protein